MFATSIKRLIKKAAIAAAAALLIGHSSLFAGVSGRYAANSNQTNVSIELHPEGNQVRGTLSINGKTATLVGAENGDSIAGVIDMPNGAPIPFQATADANGLKFSCSGSTITLARDGDGGYTSNPTPSYGGQTNPLGQGGYPTQNGYSTQTPTPTPTLGGSPTQNGYPSQNGYPTQGGYSAATDGQMQPGQGQNFRWVAPAGWNAREQGTSLTISSPDGSRSVGLYMMAVPAGTTPSAFISDVARRGGLTDHRIVGEQEMPSQTLPNGATMRQTMIAATFTANGMQFRSMFLIGAIDMNGQTLLQIRSVSAPAESFQRDAQVCGQILQSMQITANGGGSNGGGYSGGGCAPQQGGYGNGGGYGSQPQTPGYGNGGGGYGNTPGYGGATPAPGYVNYGGMR